MRFIFITLSLLITTLCAGDTAKYGYSFFNTGFQSTFYTQTYDSDQGDNFSSKAELTSPYYATGTLTRVNDTYDFSIVAGSTLFASSTDEDYQQNGHTIDPHKLSMSVSDITVLVHYKLDSKHRIIFGGGYTYELIKRYDFSTSPLDQVGVIENSIGTVALKVGYLYDNKLNINTLGWHYRAGIVSGLPFAAISSDTYPATDAFNIDASFGLNIMPHLYVGYPIFDGVELGVYSNYLYQVRFENVRATDPGGSNPTANATTSKNITQRLEYGFTVAWNFN